MKAPHGEQLKLLDLQLLDTGIVRCRYQLKNIPQAPQVDKMQNYLAEIDKKSVQLQMVLADRKRVLRGVETDIEQVNSRRVMQQQRLDDGQGSAKELMAIEKELQNIARRLNELEEQQLGIEAEIEKYNGIGEAIATKRSEAETKMAALREEMGAAAAEISADLEAKQAERANLVEQINDELLSAYEEVKERTGGVGVVQLVDLVPQGIELEFSAAEASALRLASPDEVIFSEEYDYILVRC